MRSRVVGESPHEGDWENATTVSVSCPDRLSDDPAVVDILSRGNLPLLVGDQVLAELTQHDLVESWETALSLSPKDLAQMSRLAGRRLARAFEENIESADLTEVVTDAAVLFLLGIRKHGVRTPDEIPACTIVFDVERNKARFAVPA
jgi:hypothetical protein